MTNVQPGTLIDSRYEIVELIGEGGVGTVFKAQELGTERIVAVKMLHLSLVSDQDSLHRFKREGAILASMAHPNLLRCYRFGVWNDRWPYISMEYLEGLPLSKIGPIGASRSIEIAMQVCDAMAYAHSLGIVHRDLKPANLIVLTDCDQVKVVDFGLAKILPNAAGVSQHLTQTGTLVGSTYYMSPEQCLGKKADARSDIYSLGCILYELLVGAPPFMADTPIGLMHLHATTDPKPISRNQAPAGTNAVLMQSMAKDPNRRFQSMSEFKTALQLIADGRADESPEFQQQHRPGKRKPSLLFFTTIMALALTLLVCAARLRKSENSWIRSSDSIPAEGSGKILSSNLIERCLDDSVSSAPSIEDVERWLVENGSSNSRAGAVAHAYLANAYKPVNWQLAETHRKIAQSELQLAIEKNWGDRRVQRTFSNMKLYLMLVSLLQRCDPSNLDKVCLHIEPFLAVDERRAAVRTAALALNEVGSYLAEERLWRYLSNPCKADLILLARCLRRQGKQVPVPPFSPDDIDAFGDPVEDAVLALIELKKYSSAQVVAEKITHHGYLPDLLVAFCRTAERKYDACEKRILERSLDNDRNSYYDPLVTKAFTFAALVHNDVAQGKTEVKDYGDFIAQFQANPFALTVASYLISADNPTISKRVGKLAAETLTKCSASVRSRLMLVALLSRAMNSINAPDVVIDLLRKEVGDLRAVPSAACVAMPRNVELAAELLHTLCLADRLDEATNLASAARKSFQQINTSDQEHLHLQIALAELDFKRGYSQNPNLAQLGTRVYLTAMERVTVLDRLAALYRRAHNVEAADALTAQSQKLLPDACRYHWKNMTMLYHVYRFRFCSDERRFSSKRG